MSVHGVRRAVARPARRRATWIAARARNAALRPVRIAVIGAAAFAAALLVLILVPREARRAAEAIAPRPEERPDTAALRAALAVATSEVARAETALVSAREDATRPPRPPPVAAESLPPELVARRDSLEAAAELLGRAIARAENAPLAASYRALATTEPLRNDLAVKALSDSLAEIDREREAFGALGGVDPIFVALTGRATAIGRSIQSIAEARHAALQREASSIRPRETVPDSAALAAVRRAALAAVADTLRRSAELAAAQARVAAVLAAGDRARVVNVLLDRRAARARELASTTAPPSALLGAALVFGFAAGFVVVLAGELRRPRVADTAEVATVTGAPAYAVQRPPAAPADRARRRADRDTPPLVSWRADDYQLLYLQLTGQLSGAERTLLFATVTGDDPVVTAAVAANLAATAVREARTAVVADVDVAAGVVAEVLHTRRVPGVREVVGASRSWAEAVVTAPIGRDLTLDIIPSGERGAPVPEALSARLTPELARLSRRYEAVVIACALDQALGGLPTGLPIADVVLCVRAGRTALRDLASTVEGLRLAGGRLRAAVVWEGAVPVADVPMARGSAGPDALGEIARPREPESAGLG